MHKIGQKGEDIAVEFLKDKGFKIVERNYRCKLGEIDIIAKKRNCYHFVEVKAKTVADFSREKLVPPEMNVDYRKRNKLVKLSNFYMQRCGRGQTVVPYQIDVVGVEVGPGNKVVCRYHPVAVSEDMT